MLLAILAVWAVPLVFFLTHRVAVHYYLLPSTFATVWLIALSCLPRRQNVEARTGRGAQIFRGISIALIATLALTLATNLRMRIPDSPPATWNEPSIPDELRQGKPWVWADLSAGTVVYYADVPAFKISFADRDMRWRVYTIAFAAGDRQFLVEDCPAMTQVADEVRSMHGTLELRGQVATCPYYRIHWPASGPNWLPER